MSHEERVRIEVTGGLERLGVRVNDVSRCTLESADLYSYRRDGERSGRRGGAR